MSHVSRMVRFLDNTGKLISAQTDFNCLMSHVKEILRVTNIDILWSEWEEVTPTLWHRNGVVKRAFVLYKLVDKYEVSYKVDYKQREIIYPKGQFYCIVCGDRETLISQDCVAKLYGKWVADYINYAEEYWSSF